MATIAICYGTTDGQTADIAAFIAEVVREHGYQASVVDLNGSPNRDVLAGAAAVVVAASIHVNRHDSDVVAFVRANSAVLAPLPTAFVSVSLSVLGDPAQAAGYISDFLAATGWQPTRSISVAGALRYTSYGAIKRRLMRQVARERGLATDTTRDAVYTDWAAVREFTEQFVAEAVAAPAPDLGPRTG